MKKVLIALLGAAAGAAPALAADLPYRGAAASYDYPPTFTWTGFYAGLNAGLGVGTFTNGGSYYFGNNPAGWMLGGTVGYNFQSGNLLVGAEGDWDWARIASDASTSPGVASTGIVNGLMTARVRVGYAMDRVLFYGTGGYAGANLRGVITNYPGRVSIDENNWSSGWALGLGAEYAITPHITAKAEYLFTSLASNSYFNNTVNYTSSGANLNLLRAGVNYKF